MSAGTEQSERAPMQLGGRTVVVLGLARSGRAAAELLHARGARVVGVDEGEGAAQLLSGAWAREHLHAGHPDGAAEHLEGADLLVLSPGIPTTHPLVCAAVARGIAVVSEIELAYRCSTSPVIAVTGSKGKSTAAALTGHLLAALGVRGVVAGNIGLPYSAVVHASRPHDWVVLELSSFQLETVERFHARVAVQLHISPDHLDRYASLGEYAAAKARIARHQTAQDLLVVDPDDAYGRQLARGSAARVVGFEHVWNGVGVVREADELVWRTPRTRRVLASLDDVPLLGAHNRLNVMAALAILNGLGLWGDAARQALRGFRGLEFRLQPCGEVAGIRFVNDGKATTVEAVRAGVRGLEGPLLLGLGGRNKGLDFRSLRADLQAVRAVLVFGEAAPQIARDLEGCVHIEQVGDLDDLVRCALVIGRPGDTLLFSPGCTSFDTFHDADERGHAFDAAVRRAASERRS
ncbi:MAG: UDP-N-acetylmuramoyl-L-alanine--D-glutamate ligase [Candidatus Krumholzibacteriia bacterium]